MKWIIPILLISLMVIVGCTNSAPQTQNSNTPPATGDTGGSANAGGTTPSDTGSTPTTGTDANVKVIKMDMYNFGFKYDPVDIKQGDKVKIILTDSSGIHGLAIPAFGVDSGSMSPGDSKTIEFVASKSGAFEYYCNIPCGSGHRSMRGFLTVN